MRVSFAGLTFVSSALLARFLGPEAFGVYSYALALSTLLSVPSQFGLPTLLIRETAQGMQAGRHGSVRGAWIWAGRFSLLSSLAIGAVSVAVMWYVGDRVSQVHFRTIGCALLLIPFIAAGNLAGAALRGLHRVVEGQLPELVLRPGFLTLMVPLVAVLLPGTLTAPSAMALNVVAAAMAFAVGAALLNRHTPTLVRSADPQFMSRAWLRSTLPLGFAQQMQVVNRQASVLILGVFAGDAEVGIYRVAAQVSLLAAFGLQAVNNVVAPRFAKLFAQDDMRAFQRLATLTALASSAFNLVVSAGFIVFGRPFLTAFFGPAYVEAYPVMVILLIGQATNSAAGAVATLLNMTGNERLTTLAVAVAVMANVLLNFLLAPRLGMIGAATATAASLALWNLILWVAVRRRLGINSFALGPLR